MSGDDPRSGEDPTELPGGPQTATHTPVDQAGFEDGTASAFATTRRVSTRELQALVRARHGEAAEQAVSLPPVSPEFLERLRRIRRRGMNAEGVPFGRYTVFGLIGRGGMAQIRLAADTTPEGGVRLVVIKSLLPEHAYSEARRALLVEEGRVSASLSHPNIVELFDAGEIDGIPYLTFELLDGLSLRDLSRLIEPARLPMSCIIDLGAQAAAGLAHAHAATDLEGQPLNIVHRDVTPHNVLVTRGGHVKLVDFGIARFEGRELETQHGQLRGKLGYMAPEQCRPGSFDGRVDLFALSLTLTELIAGRRVLPPTLMILQESESLIRDACADALEPVPSALVELLVKMAAIEPGDRPWPSQGVADTLRTLNAQTEGLSLAEYCDTQIFTRLLPLDMPSMTDHPTRQVKTLGASQPPEANEDGYGSTVRRLRPLPSPEVTPPTPTPRDLGDALDVARTAPVPPASSSGTEAPMTPSLVADLFEGEGEGEGATEPPTTGPWAKAVQSPLPPKANLPPAGVEVDVAPTRRVAPLDPNAAPPLAAPVDDEADLPPAPSRTPWLVLAGLALAGLAAYALFFT